MDSTVGSCPARCFFRPRRGGWTRLGFVGGTEPVLEPNWIRKVAELVREQGTNVWYALSDEAIAERLGLPSGLTRRNDTLDVWIDSGVSHEAVLKTHPELRWPADIYIEATDQHRGWLQSSLLTSLAVPQ